MLLVMERLKMKSVTVIIATRNVATIIAVKITAIGEDDMWADTGSTSAFVQADMTARIL